VDNAPVFVEGRGKFIDVTRDSSTGNWVAGAVSDRRTPMFSQSDVSVSQDFRISKSSEHAKARVGVDVFNVLNQHSPVIINQNLIRTGFINNVAVCGTPGTNCTPTMADNAGFDYGALMTKGYDYVAASNSSSKILNSLYGHPTFWQNRRSMRFQVVVTF
jgi:hypothetical protein